MLSPLGGLFLYPCHPKGLLAIDLEFSCVSAAINDLAYSFMWIEKKERRRIFIKAYLEAAGFPAESIMSRIEHEPS